MEIFRLQFIGRRALLHTPIQEYYLFFFKAKKKNVNL